MSRHNDPIEREPLDHPQPDVTPDPVPYPDGEPPPVPIDEPDDERFPVDDPSGRPTQIVSAEELARLRECLRWN